MRQVVRDRQFRIECALPFVLDLLPLSVEAGLDFIVNVVVNSRKEVVKVVAGDPEAQARDERSRLGIPLDSETIEQVAALAEELGIDPRMLAMVGDRLYTDIALGKTAGVKTVLVLSGETGRDDLENSEYQPDLVCENLADLIRMLRD